MFILRFSAVGFALVLAATIGLGRAPLRLDQPMAKFDDFGNIPCAEEIARLDDYGAYLRKVPDTLAVVIVYGGRFGTRQGEVMARLFGIRQYLVGHNTIDSHRILILNGGFWERFQIQLWTMPLKIRSSATLLVRPEISRISQRDVHLNKPAIQKVGIQVPAKLNWLGGPHPTSACSGLG